MDKESEEITLLDKFFAHYERNPFLRALVKLCPYGSAVESAVLAFYQIWSRKMDVFAEELITLDIHPAEERIQKREFLDSFAVTARRVQEATSDEKIKRFAVLFASYYEGNSGFASIDEYEEYLGIVSELSEREFWILLVLNKFESQTLLCGRNPLQRAMQFWDEFAGAVEKQAGIPGNELTATLTRIQRTGLYEHFIGGYGDYAGGMGNLTPRFTKLINALKAAGSRKGS
ncbi:MAG: hypothetical protein WCE73_22690 [Candidatus Angelobacter sp.]